MIIDQYILKKYNVGAEFMFDKFPNFGVYKNNKNGFALLWILIILRLIRTRME